MTRAEFKILSPKDQVRALCDLRRGGALVREIVAATGVDRKMASRILVLEGLRRRRSGGSTALRRWRCGASGRRTARLRGCTASATRP